MKARMPKTYTSDAEIRNTIKNYVAEEKVRIYDDVSKDVISQMLSIVLGTLEMSYGFKAKRLHKFTDDVLSYAKLMSNDYFGQDAGNIREHIKGKFGIDTEAIADELYGGVD